MKSRRWLGFAFLVLAGCAGSSVKKPMAVAAHLDKPTTSPLAEPTWETPETPPASAMLAQKAADYAKALQAASSTASQPDQGAALPPGAFSAKRKPIAQSPEVTPDQPSAPLATDATPQAQTALSVIRPRAKLSNDEPQIVPESEDFASSSARSDRNDELGNRLRRRLAQNPRDIADQLDLQLYGMLNEDPTAELAAVSVLRDSDRELIAALIDGLSNFRSTVRQDSHLLAAQKIKPLIEMADRLRSQAELCVPTVQLCNRVDAYGKYTPITPARFTAGKEKNVIVYCEVENFSAKQNSQQMWETNLTEQVLIYTDTGMLAWSDGVRPVTDECRNRRHDFFAWNLITLPKSLTLGRYLLKVSIEDKNGDRVAEKGVPFEMTADGEE
jgi:hypothetical protein